jgi:hypothetical protein
MAAQCSCWFACTFANWCQQMQALPGCWAGCCGLITLVICSTRADWSAQADVMKTCWAEYPGRLSVCYMEMAQTGSLVRRQSGSLHQLYAAVASRHQPWVRVLFHGLLLGGKLVHAPLRIFVLQVECTFLFLGNNCLVQNHGLQ